MKDNITNAIKITFFSIFMFVIFYYISIFWANYFHSSMMNMNGNNSNKNVSSEELIYWKNIEAIVEKKQEIVNLKEGDNYTIEIVKVKKMIWNKEVEMLSYNGSIPGPIIKAKVWIKAKITIVNKVPDLETTLHSHGLRLSDMFDWVVKDMMWKQDPIKYGSSFTYEVSFPDEWVFWYHPHLREDIQQELWLYWNYIVEPIWEDSNNFVNREWPIILDDILLNWDKVKPFYKDFTNYVLMWRFWNTMFVNGSSDYEFNMKSGEVVRAYITDTSNTRVFNLKIPWVKMKLVWSDIWKYEEEKFIESLIISPWERYIVDLYAPDSWIFDILNSTSDEDIILWKVNVSSEKVEISFKDRFETLNTNEIVKKDIENYRKYFSKEVDKKLTLELWNVGEKWWIDESDMWMMWWHMMWDNDEIEWDDNMPMMNKESTSLNYEWKIIDEDTKKENMDINWQFKKGDIVKIRIENKKDWAHPMQHPFHMHGQRFLVIERNGEKQENFVWKDTVLIKTWETVDILVDMSNPGEWMAHCHISEHLFSGMMMHFSIK